MDFVSDFALDVALLLELVVDIGAMQLAIFQVFVEGLEVVVLLEVLQLLLPVHGVVVGLFGALQGLRGM